MTSVTFAGTRAEAEALIRGLPAALAGVAPDPFGPARRVQLRAGVALLSQVQQDFLTKSRGGTGRDGIKWPPLAAATIAARRTTGPERKALGVGKGTRPTLTPAQDAAWKKKFGQTLAWARVDLGEAAALRLAGAVAWKFVKDTLGAKTKLELLGGRQVDTLRDTGELFRAFTPGVADRPSDAPGQVFRTGLGKVVVGTNKKPWHHDGNPARGLPARRFWPADGSIPEAWWPPVRAAIDTGLVEQIAAAVGGAA